MENRNIDDKLNRIESRISVMMAGVSAEMADISSDVRTFRQDLLDVQKTRVEKDYLDRISATLGATKAQLDTLRAQTQESVAEVRALIMTLSDQNAGHTTRFDSLSSEQTLKIAALHPELRTITSDLSAKVVDWELRNDVKFETVASQIEMLQNQSISRGISLEQAINAFTKNVSTQILSAAADSDAKLNATSALLAAQEASLVQSLKALGENVSSQVAAGAATSDIKLDNAASQLTAQTASLEQNLKVLSENISSQVAAGARQSRIDFDFIAQRTDGLDKLISANRDELAKQAVKQAQTAEVQEESLKGLRNSLREELAASAQQNATKLETGFDAMAASNTSIGNRIEALSQRLEARLQAMDQANTRQVVLLQQAYREGLAEASRAILDDTRSMVRQNELVILDFAQAVEERDARQEAYLTLTLNKMRPIVYFLHRVKNKIARLFGPKPIV